MQTWIILAKDDEAIYCYRFTASTTSVEQVLARFKRIAISEKWEPFKETKAFLVLSEPQRELLTKVGTFLTK